MACPTLGSITVYHINSARNLLRLFKGNPESDFMDHIVRDFSDSEQSSNREVARRLLSSHAVFTIGSKVKADIVVVKSP